MPFSTEFRPRGTSYSRLICCLFVLSCDDDTMTMPRYSEVLPVAQSRPPASQMPTHETTLSVALSTKGKKRQVLRSCRHRISSPSTPIRPPGSRRSRKANNAAGVWTRSLPCLLASRQQRSGSIVRKRNRARLPSRVLRA